MSPLIEPDDLGSFGSGHPTRPVQVDDVVVTIEDRGLGEVRGLDADTGAVRWRYRTDSAADDVAIAEQAPDGLVLIAPSVGDVTALETATGDVRWMYHEMDDDLFPGAPAVDGGVVYLPGSYAMEGDARAPVVAALDAASGRIIWESPLLPDTELQWAPPTVTDDLVIVADTADTQRGDKHLYALHRPSGRIEWTFEFTDRQQGFHEMQPLVTDDVVISVDGETLYGLELRTGEELWHRSTDDLANLFGIADGGVVIDVGNGIEVVDARTGATRDRNLRHPRGDR